MTASIPLAWLGTYLIHSTILLGAVWVAARWLGRRGTPLSLPLEERFWKTALVGGLLTATLQIALAYAPGLDLPTFAPWAAEEASPSLAAAMEPVPVPLPVPAGDLGAEPAGLATSAAPHPGLRSLAALLPGWQRLVLAAWILGAAAGLGLLALSWIGLWKTLRGRRTVDEGATRQALDRLLATTPGRLGGRRPVRLTASARVPVPIALGIVEREICVPERALETFGPRRQEGLLAHELAHLERRDPAWTLALRTVEAALFLQPLNRLARKRLLEISEDRSDTWAVEQTGDRVGLARSLTDVATWLAGLDPAPMASMASPVPGMAGDRRALGRRVRRILDGASAGEGRPPGRWSLPLAAAALLVIGCLAPGVAPVVPAEAAVTQEADEATRLAEAAEAREREERAEAAAEQDGPREFHGEWEADEDFEDFEDFEHLEDLEHLEHLEHLEGLEHLGHLEHLEDLEMDFELDPETEAELERLAHMAEELARHAQPDMEALEELELQLNDVVERSMAVHGETLEVLHEALAKELEGLETVHELSAEERERLDAELRRLSEEAARIAEQARPDEEELARLRAQARRLAEEARPTEEEIERIHREVERMSREAREINREELRRVHEQIERNRSEVERRIREEVRRELAAERARMEAEREEMRAERDAQRRELEERRRELEERRRELEEEEPPR